MLWFFLSQRKFPVFSCLSNRICLSMHCNDWNPLEMNLFWDCILHLVLVSFIFFSKDKQNIDMKSKDIDRNDWVLIETITVNENWYFVMVVHRSRDMMDTARISFQHQFIQKTISVYSQLSVDISDIISLSLNTLHMLPHDHREWMSYWIFRPNKWRMNIRRNQNRVLASMWK